MAVQYRKNISYEANAEDSALSNQIDKMYQGALAGLSGGDTTSTTTPVNRFPDLSGYFSAPAGATSEQIAAYQGGQLSKAPGEVFSAPFSEVPGATPGTKSMLLSQYNKESVSPQTFKYGAPSPTAAIKSFSEVLGGGQYISDPGNTDYLQVKRFNNPMQTTLERAGMPSNMYQIEHTIPLWAGGTDTPGNKTLMRTEDHDRKTKIQAVAYSLYNNPESKYNLSRPEALAVALNWSDKNDSRIPDVDETEGRIPTKIAEQIYESWQKPETPSIWQVIKGMPHAAADLTGKYISPVIPDILEEPIKGAIGGFVPFADLVIPELASSKGAKPIPGISDKANEQVAGILRGAGWLLGNIASIFLGTAYVKAGFNALSKGAKIATGIKSAESAALVAKEAGGAAYLSNLLKTSKATGKILPGVPVGNTMQTFGTDLAGAAFNKKLGTAAASGTAMAILNQTHIPFDATAEERLGQITRDVIYGAAMPFIPVSIKGGALLGMGSFSTEVMLGSSAKDAAITAVTLMGFHSLGRSQVKKLNEEALLTPWYAAKRANENIRYPRFKLGKKAIGENLKIGKVDIGTKTFKPRGIKINGKTYFDKIRIDQDTYRAIEDQRINKANIDGALWWRANLLGEEFKTPTTPQEVADQNKQLLNILENRRAAGELTVQDLKREQAKVDTTGKYLANPEEFSMEALRADEEAINEAASILSTDWRKNILGKGYIETTDETILQKQNTGIIKILEKRYAEGKLTDEQLNTEKQKALVSARTKYKEGLPMVVRNQEDIQDLLSLGEKMRENFGGSIGTTRPLDLFVNNLTEQDIKAILDDPDNLMNEIDIQNGYGKVGIGGMAFGEGPNNVKNPVFDKVEQVIDEHPKIVKKVYMQKFNKITGEYRELTDKEATSKANKDNVVVGYKMVVVLSPAPENTAMNVRINNDLPSWKRMQNPQNTVKIHIPVPDAEGESSSIVGNLFVSRKGGAPKNGKPFATTRNNINWAWDRAKINRPDGKFTEAEMKKYDLYNPELNKDSIAREFDKRKQPYTLAVMTYIPETFKTKKGTVEKTSWAYLNMNKEVFDGKMNQMARDIEARSNDGKLSAFHDANIAEIKKEVPMGEVLATPAEIDDLIAAPVKSKAAVEAKKATIEPLKKQLDGLKKTEKEYTDINKKVPPQLEAEISDVETSLAKVVAETENFAELPLIADVAPTADITVPNVIEQIRPQDNSQMTTRGIKGIDDALDIINKGKDLDDPTYVSKEYNKPEVVRKLATDKMEEFGNDKIAAGDAFIEDIRQKNIAAGIDHLIPKEAYNPLRKVFLDSVNNKPTKTLVINVRSGNNADTMDNVSTYFKDETPTPPSTARNYLDEVNVKEGENLHTADIELSKEANTDLGARSKFSSFDEEAVLRSNDYVPMYQSGGTGSSLVGLSKPSKAYMKKYNLADADGNLDEDAYRKHYFVDIIGFPADGSYGGDKVNKRSKLFDARQPETPLYGKTIRSFVLKSPTFADKGFTEADFNPKHNSKAAIDAFIGNPKEGIPSKEWYDGGKYIGQDMADEIMRNGGYAEARVNMKPYLAYKNGKDGLILAKGLITVMDKKTEAHWLAEVNKSLVATGQKPLAKFGKYDMITFEPNIKSGLPKSFKDGPLESIHVFETPSEAWKMEYSQPKIQKGSWSPSMYAKFEEGRHGVSINKIMGDKLRPEFDKLREFSLAAQRITDNKIGLQLIKDYAELGKNDYTKELYGYVKKQIETGAWKNLAGDQIESLITNQWQSIMNGRQFSGDTYKLVMDWGVKKGGQHLTNDEAMLSRSQWKSLGKPDNVLVFRQPNTDPTKMFVAKVIIGEDHGVHNLKKQNVIVSHFNVLAKMDGDHDGDQIGLIALGLKKNQLPEEIGTYIKAEQDLIGGNLLVEAPAKRYNPDGTVKKEIVFKKWGEKGEAEQASEIRDLTTQGGKGIADVARVSRLMEFINSNKKSIELSWNVKVKRSVDTRKINIMISNIASDAISKPEDLKRLFALHPGMSLQDIVLENNFDMSRLSKQNKIKFVKFLNSLQTPHNITKNPIKRVFKSVPVGYGLERTKAFEASDEMLRQVSEYNKAVNAIANVKKGPVQLAMEATEEIPAFKNIYKTQTFQTKADEAGMAAVKEAFGDKIIMTEPVKNFIAVVKREKNISKDATGKRKTFPAKKKTIEEYYRANIKDPADKQSIIAWAASSDEANLNRFAGKNKKGESKPAAVVRLHNIITDNPTVAETYNKANESVQYFTEAKPDIAPENMKTEKMDFDMPAKENIYGKDTSTFDAIVSGDRTSTTRGYWRNGVPKEGGIVSFEAPDGRTVDVQVTKVTPVPKNPSQTFKDLWSKKEGWTVDAAVKRGFLKGQQVEFKVIDKPAGVKAPGKTILTKTGVYTAKDQLKANKANKFIGRGSDKSSTNQYAKDYGDMANTGVYNEADKVFVSAEGNRTGRKSAYLEELDKAIRAKATIITDDKVNRSRSYNVGEREVAAHLEKNGYREISSGEWVPTATFGKRANTPQGAKAFVDSLKKPEELKTLGK